MEYGSAEESIWLKTPSSISTFFNFEFTVKGAVLVAGLSFSFTILFWNLLTIEAEKFRTRKYEVPDNIEDIVAKCDKGVLTLDLYKSKKKTKVIKVS